MGYPVVLPPLHYQPSPNQSPRSHWSPAAVTAVCVHRWAVTPQTTKAGATSTYHAVVAALCRPQVQAAAHIVYGGGLCNEATQLVPWSEGAWACEAFNGCTDNIELPDAVWTGQDPAGWKVAARIVAFRLHQHQLPAVWTKDPMKERGVCRHYDLGQAGGGHTDPTTDEQVWQRFMARVQLEARRGDFRAHWGH